jgi:Tfp pilus assembly protein PilX
MIGPIHRKPIPRRAAARPQHQRGVVLFIALIVLVAMTLTGIAIMRSVDTGNLVSGNTAFRRSAIATADWGIDYSYKFLKDNVATGKLDADSPADGYFSVASDPPDWNDDSYWNGKAVTVGTDAAGNTVQIIVHRLCDNPGPWQGVNCATVTKKGGEAGNSLGFFGAQYQGTTVVYFRVSVRVQGARSTSSIVQSNIAVQM